MPCVAHATQGPCHESLGPGTVFGMTGTEIRTLRTTYGLDVMRFSALVGVNASTVYRWEAAEIEKPNVEPFQQRLLNLLRAHCLDTSLPAKIRIAIDKLGALYGLHVFLGAVYDSVDAEAKSSPTPR